MTRLSKSAPRNKPKPTSKDPVNDYCMLKPGTATRNKPLYRCQPARKPARRLGIANFDLDGPAENVRMVQLATDRVLDGSAHASTLLQTTHQLPYQIRIKSNRR